MKNKKWLLFLVMAMLSFGCDGPAEKAGEKLDAQVAEAGREVTELKSEIENYKGRIKNMQEELSSSKEQLAQARIELQEIRQSRQQILNEFEALKNVRRSPGPAKDEAENFGSKQ